MKIAKCADCAFSEEAGAYTTDNILYCKEGPPRGFREWPQVFANDWCGKFVSTSELTGVQVSTPRPPAQVD